MRIRSAISITRAQRLSASSEFTHLDWDHEWTEVLCSTPFGIIGIHTPQPNESEIKSSCAQRLSASSEFTHQLATSLNPSHIGAQRLSASSEFTLTKWQHATRHVHVLNAFRHHRNSHRLAGVSYACTGWVLNAFRHHRNSHNGDLDTGFKSSNVLNAFRHHRNSHSRQHRFLFRFLQCSTPFGIIGIHTFGQIPSGGFICVLNAFRHHRNSHCAEGRSTHATIDVLNAFRHHRNSHRFVGVAVFLIFFVLNAFRHHRNSHSKTSSVMIDS